MKTTAQELKDILDDALQEVTDTANIVSVTSLLGDAYTLAESMGDQTSGEQVSAMLSTLDAIEAADDSETDLDDESFGALEGVRTMLKRVLGPQPTSDGSIETLTDAIDILDEVFQHLKTDKVARDDVLNRLDTAVRYLTAQAPQTETQILYLGSAVSQELSNITRRDGLVDGQQERVEQLIPLLDDLDERYE